MDAYDDDDDDDLRISPGIPYDISVLPCLHRSTNLGILPPSPGRGDNATGAPHHSMSIGNFSHGPAGDAGVQDADYLCGVTGRRSQSAAPKQSSICVEYRGLPLWSAYHPCALSVFVWSCPAEP